MAGVDSSSTALDTRYRMVDLIAAKRHGLEHSQSQIDYIVDGIMDSSIPDYQLSAWLIGRLLEGHVHRGNCISDRCHASLR